MKQKTLTLLCLLLLFLPQGVVRAQNEEEKKAYALLDKAFGGFNEANSNVGLYFEGIAYGIADPLKIFTLDVYRVVRGGFVFVDGNKYEMQLGTIKTLCDGNISTAIDETSKMMLIDSVRKETTYQNFGDSLNITKLINETFGDSKLNYLGEETINAHRCHKIKAVIKGGNLTDAHVLYWVDTTTGQLYLMAEWQNKSYDVYWFSKTGPAPKNHSYQIYLPKKELTTYYGYNVIDNRYLLQQTKRNN
jgi:hypothetical protein